MLFDLAKLGADATDKCYYYIMEEQDKKMKRDCFLFLMYSGYMPLKLKTLSSGDDGDEKASDVVEWLRKVINAKEMIGGGDMNKYIASIAD